MKKLKIRSDEILFNKWKKFEKEYGFHECNFANIVQNDIEIDPRDLIDILSTFREMINDKTIAILADYESLINATKKHIQESNKKEE